MCCHIILYYIMLDCPTLHYMLHVHLLLDIRPKPFCRMIFFMQGGSILICHLNFRQWQWFEHEPFEEVSDYNTTSVQRWSGWGRYSTEMHAFQRHKYNDVWFLVEHENGPAWMHEDHDGLASTLALHIRK